MKDIDNVFSAVIETTRSKIEHYQDQIHEYHQGCNYDPMAPTYATLVAVLEALEATFFEVWREMKPDAPTEEGEEEAP